MQRSQAARRLFAQALEAKGGLKIYTIHGFCERLLQRFPLEAAGDAAFRRARRARGGAAARALRSMPSMARAAEDRDGPLGQALAKIVAVTVEDYFRKIVDTVLGRRGDLARMMALHEGDPDWTRCEERCLKRLFGVGEEVSEAELTEQLADVLADSDIDALLAALEVNGAESRTDQELRDGLQAARAASGAARVAALEADFSHGQEHAAPIRVQQGVAAGRASALRRSRSRARPLRQRSRPKRAQLALRRGERGGASARRRDPSRV